MSGSMPRWLALLLMACWGLSGASGCMPEPPIVNVATPPCECDCRFRATAPQVGRGCYVKDDLLICPLVRRTLDVEPAFPAEDPRCERGPDGALRCEVAE